MSTDEIQVVSFSEVFKLQTCKRQYYYRFILGLTKAEGSDAMDTGTKGHKLLQHFYEFMRMGNNKEEAIRLTTALASEDLHKSKFVDGNLLKAWTLVDNYIRETNFTAESEMIENRFLVPAGKILTPYGTNEEIDYFSNIYIGFTPDLVLRRKGNFLDIEDAKFVQRAWPQKKINRFPQIKLYQLFLEAMGYEISRCVLRMFNVTTGKIEANHYVMKPAEKYTLTRDFLTAVKETIEFRNQSEEVLEQAPRTMNYTACQFCDFENPCTLQAQGKSAVLTLQNDYVKSTYDYTK